MEAIFFAADIVGIVWLLYWAIINDARRPGAPTTGLFAYRETIRNYPQAGTPSSPGGTIRPPTAGAPPPAATKRRPPAARRHR